MHNSHNINNKMNTSIIVCMHERENFQYIIQCVGGKEYIPVLYHQNIENKRKKFFKGRCMTNETCLK